MTVTPHGLNDEGTTRPHAATETSVSVAATGAIFSASAAGSNSLVVKVHGDIDMRSAPILTDFVLSRVTPDVRMILDLSDVDFFAIAGLTIFTALDEAHLDWCLVEGYAVHRLLQAAAVVPTAQRFDSVENAVH
ncbi:STAS domain-containing protein [Rhodococcus sp. RS1C4]|nr:anti-sigma factor antagonist [Rhodococcus sp. RS1C4]